MTDFLKNCNNYEQTGTTVVIKTKLDFYPNSMEKVKLAEDAFDDLIECLDSLFTSSTVINIPPGDNVQQPPKNGTKLLIQTQKNLKIIHNFLSTTLADAAPARIEELQKKLAILDSL